MSILLGVAEKLKTEKNNLWGKIYLLFQPSEEIAKGAKEVLNDPEFKYLHIDYVFALHNLPGFEKQKIILKKGIFAATSKGLVINLKGKSSHAGHPENGNNPIFAMMDIINALTDISKESNLEKDRSLITIIHTKLGEIAFGTSPGDGVVMATFRSTSPEKMKFMSKKATRIIKGISAKYDLKCELKWVEVFPILKNDDECVDIIKRAAAKKGLESISIDKPFSWTEDFSYFTQKYKAAFFGLGSGLDHPQLHNSDYDFPDEILPAGVDIFLGIIKEILDMDSKEEKIE
jgi:amidohydrolase